MWQKQQGGMFLFVWFNALRPRQQFFSYVGSSCVEPILSKDQCVLLKDTMQLLW